MEQKAARTTEAEITAYYQSYWSMQIDCWEYFKLGVLPPVTYATWLLYVFDLVRAGVTGNDIGVQDDGFDAHWTQAHWQSVGRSMARNNIEYRVLLEKLIALAEIRSDTNVDDDFVNSVRSRQNLRKQLLRFAKHAARGAGRKR